MEETNMLTMTSGFIFLGALGLIVMILVIVYCFVKNKLCCCQKSELSKDEAAEEPLINDFYANEDTFPPPYDKILIHEQRKLGEYKYVTTDFSDTLTSDFSGDDVLTDDVLSDLPNTYMSVRTRADSIGTDSQISSGDLLGGLKRMKKDTYVDGVSLKMSLMYSKKDLFLMLTVAEVIGMPNKASGGYDYIRVSITLFPEKKYRSKTKIQYVGEDVVKLGDSFKFSNVSRDSLFTSAFRFRLYGRKKRGKEVCVGELFTQLADVAQRSFGFVTVKTFGRKKPNMPYLP